MNAPERAPSAVETKEETQPRAPEAALEELDQDAGKHELSIVAADLAARARVQEAFPPEQQADALARVRESSKSASEKLRTLKIAAALATALMSLEPSGADATEPEPLPAASLAENPRRLTELLEGVLLTVEREQARSPRPELLPLKEEASGVLRRMQDGNRERGGYGTLALRIGETAARALASAAGLGLGVAGYDIVKEIAKAVRDRRG